MSPSVTTARWSRGATASTTKTFKAVDDSNVLPFLDHTHLRGIGQVRAQIGTEFDRVYTFEHFGLEKIRHSIEPDVRYLYVPETDQQLFDVDICRDPSGSGAISYSGWPTVSNCWPTS
jgi:hypothetical protein